MNTFFLVNEAWEQRPTSIIDFKEHICQKFGFKYLNNEQEISVYRSFMGFKREHRVFLYLGKKGYLVRKTNLDEDIRRKVDLVAHKNGVMYFIQVKSPNDFMDPSELSAFRSYCRYNGAEGLIAVVNKKCILVNDIGR
jgi:hypothetical protein